MLYIFKNEGKGRYILKVSNLSYSYKYKKILQDINFSLEYGEHISVIGINGSGKSTLLKCLSGFLNYKGSVKIDGEEVRNINKRDLAKKITTLPQNTYSYFDYKVFEVASFGIYANDGRDDERVDCVLKNLGIYHLRNNYMSELSCGEVQMVFISRVFVQDSDIILMDELSNNLDIKSQIHIIKNLNNWFKDKILINVFHDLNLVKNLNNDVMVIKNSKIYKYGSVYEILKRDVLKEIYGIDIKDFIIDLD